MTIAPIDIAFFLIIFIFVVTALVKGFVGEFFGKAAVILSIAAGIIFTKTLKSYVIATIKNPVLAAVISFLLIFAVVFLVIKILEHFVKKLFEGEIMNSLDKSLAVVLGIFEGFVVIYALLTVIMIIKPWVNATPLIEKSVFYSLLKNLVDSSSQLVHIKE